jgi:hypothetical protein
MMAMNQDDTERWLDVLAGKSVPNDAETLKAAALREIILEDEKALEPMDAATETRIMNTLRARGAFDVPKPAQPRSLLARAWEWLFPPGSGHTGRYAAMAAVAMAVVAAPVVYQNLRQAPGDDGMSIKSAPGEAIVFAANPDQDAAGLLAVLARNGVAGQVRSEGSDRLVEAQVSADRLPQVHTEMMNMGLAVPENGTLKVRFRKAP